MASKYHETKGKGEKPESKRMEKMEAAMGKKMNGAGKGGKKGH
jgi:hypothetical protein